MKMNQEKIKMPKAGWSGLVKLTSEGTREIFESMYRVC